jgi:hypothetical protein
MTPKVMSLFFSKEGKHLVSGGTSAHVVANYLHQKIETTSITKTPSIPPISTIKGVDLVTEGVITLNKSGEAGRGLSWANQAYFDWSYKQDGASFGPSPLRRSDRYLLLCRLRGQSRPSGSAFNITISTKMELVERTHKILQQMGKHIKVAYF